MDTLQTVELTFKQPCTSAPSAGFLPSSFAALVERSPCENEPTQDGRAGQDRGEQVTKQDGSPDGTSEGGQIRRDVVDGGYESPVYDMGDSDEDTTSKGYGQEEAHHSRILAESPEVQPPPTSGTSGKRRARSDPALQVAIRWRNRFTPPDVSKCPPGFRARRSTGTRLPHVGGAPVKSRLAARMPTTRLKPLTVWGSGH